MHIADWYTTFSAMLGVDAKDYHAIRKGLPDVDGFNMWPLVAGLTKISPRYELVMNKNTLFQGDYKLIIGSSTKYAIWQGKAFPNASSPSQRELESTKLVCDTKKNWGCLFNVQEDPGEHEDLAEEMPSMVTAMHDRLEQLKQNFWESHYYGENACPDNFEEVAAEYVTVALDGELSVDACGCWMSVHNYNKFAGPYQDLDEAQINYDGDVMRESIKAMAARKAKLAAVTRFDFREYVWWYLPVILGLLAVFAVKARRSRKRLGADGYDKYDKHDGYGSMHSADSARV